MLDDHPLRFALANELHARPFPWLESPCTAIFIAIKQSNDAAGRDRSKDREHLIALLDRHGSQHPQPGATHWFGVIGRHKLKWEQHTEFVTYTLFIDGPCEKPFDPDAFDAFPEDWLAAAPGVRMTSAVIQILPRKSEEEMAQVMADWFVPESLAVSYVLDDTAAIAGDFRIDASGHMRFAIFANPDAGSRRIGRIVQRVTEIETYKTMSMLGLSRVRELSASLGGIEVALSELVGRMTGSDASPEETLQKLLAISAELENMVAKTSFRFGATGAYEALINQRIEVLREERFQGRQTFGEFMMRRFDPAMRTVKSTERRLNALADRAIRAGDLLRTRVDVERSAQNQKLLESMDKRADLQLRLQKTVEGLSVVAISYYAVNLVIYIASPAAVAAGLSKVILGAVATPLVVLGVWWMVRRIRQEVE